MRLNRIAHEPYYQALLYQVESRIVYTDNKAKREGIALTDSNVRSALLKVIASMKGKTPKFAREKRRDEIVAELIDELIRCRKGIKVDRRDEVEDLPDKDWISALEAVADSVKRRSRVPGGARSYLELITEFIRLPNQTSP